MSALGRNLGNFVLTFSQAKTSFKTINGLRSGLLSCCGSTVQPLAKDSHHNHKVNLNVKSNYNGIRTELYNNSNESTKVFAVRQYSSKIQATPTPKSLLANICETEMTEFQNLFPEGSTEIEAYLKESGFELTKDTEYAILTKKFADGTEICVRFDTLEENQNFDENLDEQEEFDENEQEEEEEAEEEEEEEQEEEEQEEQEEGEEGEENEEDAGNPHDHPFEVQITPKGNPEGKITFGCYAEHDGSYVVSGFFKGGFKEYSNPVDISGTTPEFQENILLLLQQYGVDERLAFFVHDYVHNKKVTDYIDSFKALKEFVSEK